MLSDDRTYKVWSIDLDDFRAGADDRGPDSLRSPRPVQKYKMELHFTYRFEDVDNQPLLDFIVRSDCQKEALTSNRKLFVFLLHTGKLFYWEKGQAQLGLAAKTQAEELLQINQHEFLIRCDNQLVEKRNFCIKKITVMYSTFQTRIVYEEKQHPLKSVKAFAFDYKKFVLVLVIKVARLADKGKMLVNIIDCAEANLLCGVPVGDKAMVGRLKSGLVRFVDGHLYFGN